MKTREIVVGGTYSNGKGRVRSVIEIMPDYALYDWMASGQDCVRYTSERTLPGNHHDMTLTAFARWAKERIS